MSHLVRFDTRGDYTSDAIRRALRGEHVESFVDPEIMREVEAILAQEEQQPVEPSQGDETATE